MLCLVGLLEVTLWALLDVRAVGDPGCNVAPSKHVEIGSLAKHHPTYYNFYFNEKELIPVDCVYKFSGHIHRSHEKKKKQSLNWNFRRSDASYLVLVVHLTLPYSSWLAWHSNC